MGKHGWAPPSKKLAWGKGFHLPAPHQPPFIPSCGGGQCLPHSAPRLPALPGLAALAPPSVKCFFRKRGCMCVHTSPHHLPPPTYFPANSHLPGAQLSWGECKIDPPPRMLHGSREPKGRFCRQLLAEVGKWGSTCPGGGGGRGLLPLVGAGCEEMSKDYSTHHHLQRTQEPPPLVFFC